MPPETEDEVVEAEDAGEVQERLDPVLRRPSSSACAGPSVISPMTL